MASTTDTKQKDEVSTEATSDQAKLPQLGALEEDDEFEEFPVAGARLSNRVTRLA